MKARSRLIVDARRFEKPDRANNPQYPVELAPCACDGMDAYTCGQHRRPPEYSYVLRGMDRWTAIRPGEWYFRSSDGNYKVFADAAFHERFEPLPAAASDPPPQEHQK